MPANATIEDAIKESLDLDPRLPDPDQVAVAVDAGTATLFGRVGTYNQRHAAVNDAFETDGVDDVDDQIDVELLDEDRREDADIRGFALQILMWDTEVPSDLIDVNVTDGWITLTGTVNYQFESDAAYDDVAGLYGVTGVTNDLTILNP